MGISPEDAAEALKVVEASERRSLELRGYQSVAPHLMLWGVLWAAGYMLDFFLPDLSAWGWSGLTILGWLVGYRIVAKDRHNVPDMRFFGIVIAFVLFTAASGIIMMPHKPYQMAAFVPIVVSLFYVMVGLFGMPRLVIAGASLFVLTLIGYFLFLGLFLPWMAIVGGGTLILSGVWIRRA